MEYIHTPNCHHSRIQNSGTTAKTQLSKGDPDIVKEELLHGTAASTTVTQQMVDVQMMFQCAKSLNTASVKKNAPSAPAHKILCEAGKLYLSDNFRPALINGTTLHLEDLQVAQLINVDAYRAELVNLIKVFEQQGMRAQRDMLNILAKALEQKQLVPLTDLKRVFEALCAEVELPRATCVEAVDELLRLGVLAPFQAADLRKTLTALRADKIKLSDLFLTHYKPLNMVMRQDGTVGSKRAAVDSSKGFYVPKGAQPQVQTNRKLMMGQQSGPSRPIQQNLAIQPDERTVSADLKT